MESIAVDFFVFTFKDRSILFESILNKLPREKDLKRSIQIWKRSIYNVYTEERSMFFEPIYLKSIQIL